MSDANEPQYLEIQLGQRRKWMGRIAYAIVFLGLGVLLVALFVGIGVGLALAIAVVTFMLIYMVVMGVLAHRRLQDRDGRRGSP